MEPNYQNFNCPRDETDLLAQWKYGIKPERVAPQKPIVDLQQKGKKIEEPKDMKKNVRPPRDEGHLLSQIKYCFNSWKAESSNEKGC